MARFFRRTAGAVVDGNEAGAGVEIGPCRECGGNVMLTSRGGLSSVACSGRPLCGFQVYLPRTITSVEVSNELCPGCQHGNVRKMDLRWDTLPIQD